MTEIDRQRIAEWIGDAFAILCVRISSVSTAERKLRLGFEAILRQLGTSPLHIVARGTPPPFNPVTATTSDLRHILKALDSCLAVFHRYEKILTISQRRIEVLVRATRRYAEEELAARRIQPALPEAVSRAA
jgi:hypothetical protein